MQHTIFNVAYTDNHLPVSKFCRTCHSDQGTFQSFVGDVEDRISGGGRDSSTRESDVMGGLHTTFNNLSWRQDTCTTKVCLCSVKLALSSMPCSQCLHVHNNQKQLQ